ncbi:MAG: DUF6209 family protein [Myxococcota bacterium]
MLRALTAVFFLSSIVLMPACGQPAEDESIIRAEPSSAPLTGKADGTDSADRDCHIVLRSVERSPGPTGYEVDCSTGYCWFVWEGELDVSKEALEAGAEPFVLYRAGLGEWWETAAAPATDLGERYQRFRFRLDEQTLPAGMGGSAIASARIELIPFLRLNGARHFDHNRLPGDLDVYVLDDTTDFGLGDEPSACNESPSAIAHLEMDLGWTTVQRGTLVAAGELILDYDIGRLPECRGTHNGYPAWDVIAHARFQPGGEQVSTSVRAFHTDDGTPLSSGYSVPATISIPPSATEVELWFENRSGAGNDCRSWDSNFGENYRFAVLPEPPAPVGWAGDLGNGFNRECRHVYGLAEPTTLGSWEMQRACLFIDGDVWISGLTDSGGDPAQVLARVEYSIDGAETEKSWLHFVEQAGNNFRYRWSLPRERLMRTDWSEIRWAFLFSTDGVEWYRVGRSSGPEGGDPRTIVNGS